MKVNTARRSIPDQIASNRRLSVVFSFFIILMLTGLGGAIVGAFHPSLWYYGAGGAALLGVILAIVARAQGPEIVLSIAGAHPARHMEDQVLDNVTEEMAIAAGIQKPALYVIDDDSPNAFATGMDPRHGAIAVTSGLIQMMDREELQGVVAHEMSHIRNYDVRFTTTMALIVGVIPLLADVFRFSLWGGRRSDDEDSQGANIWAIVGIVLAILAPIASYLLQMAISRKREYLADSTAAQLTRNPEGLARALKKIEAFPYGLAGANRAIQHMYFVNPFRDGGASLFDTHPSVEQRVSALMGVMGADALSDWNPSLNMPAQPSPPRQRTQLPIPGAQVLGQAGQLPGQPTSGGLPGQEPGLTTYTRSGQSNPDEPPTSP
ncbi:MAG: M48 family metallopeptidase [Fimbriimonas ginsengisoli]|uniref:Protease HtpX homolog n=1 Tax=Fimbriimonas ginsengisoli TaxID=1005039 RepID=A0A931LQD9_FIMGI|nr:M48 family metallopeptidase [Fimbriimonas ginsengisoli]MBI3720946.1 M48 family metallopeptidase [Fimbriimonas ginsengisoli]